MKVSAAILMAIQGLFLSAAAFASEQAGTVNYYTIARQGTSALLVTGSRTSVPACATDVAWSLDGSTSNGAQLSAAIMTAKATRQSISVTGTGTCDPSFPTREMVAWISFY